MGLVTLLLDYGADKNVQNDAGLTPMDVGVQQAAMGVGLASRSNGWDPDLGAMEVVQQMQQILQPKEDDVVRREPPAFARSNPQNDSSEQSEPSTAIDARETNSLPASTPSTPHQATAKRLEPPRNQNLSPADDVENASAAAAVRPVAAQFPRPPPPHPYHGAPDSRVELDSSMPSDGARQPHAKADGVNVIGQEPSTDSFHARFESVETAEHSAQPSHNSQDSEAHTAVNIEVSIVGNTPADIQSDTATNESGNGKWYMAERQLNESYEFSVEALRHERTRARPPSGPVSTNDYIQNAARLLHYQSLASGQQSDDPAEISKQPPSNLPSGLPLREIVSDAGFRGEDAIEDSSTGATPITKARQELEQNRLELEQWKLDGALRRAQSSQVHLDEDGSHTITIDPLVQGATNSDFSHEFGFSSNDMAISDPSTLPPTIGSEYAVHDRYPRTEPSTDEHNATLLENTDAEQESPDAEAGIAAATAESSNRGGSDHLDLLNDGDVEAVDSHGFSASNSALAHTVQGDGHLPRGWTKCEDQYGQEYFFHEESGQSQWERPVEHEVSIADLDYASETESSTVASGDATSGTLEEMHPMWLASTNSDTQTRADAFNDAESSSPSTTGSLGSDLSDLSDFSGDELDEEKLQSWLEKRNTKMWAPSFLKKAAASIAKGTVGKVRHLLGRIRQKVSDTAAGEGATAARASSAAVN